MDEPTTPPEVDAEKQARREKRKKERRFAIAYSSCLNGASAARMAGYGQKNCRNTAFNLLTKPHILDLIDEENEKRAKRLQLDGDWVVLQWHSCYLAAREVGDLQSALKALDSIAKFLGMYEKDNRQRFGSDLEAVKNRLKERGIDIDMLNRQSLN